MSQKCKLPTPMFVHHIWPLYGVFVVSMHSYLLFVGKIIGPTHSRWSGHQVVNPIFCPCMFMFRATLVSVNSIVGVSAIIVYVPFVRLYRVSIAAARLCWTARSLHIQIVGQAVVHSLFEAFGWVRATRPSSQGQSAT